MVPNSSSLVVLSSGSRGVQMRVPLLASLRRFSPILLGFQVGRWQLIGVQYGGLT